MSVQKSWAELQKMHRACTIVVNTIDVLAKAAQPGVTTKELDKIAKDEIEKAGAKPAFLGYRGYPATLCISINEEVVHGIPSGKRKLKEGEGSIASSPVGAEALAGLLRLVEDGTLSGKIAKDVFEKAWTTGEPPAAIVEREGLRQVSDTGALEAAIGEVIAASPEQVASYRGGKAATLGWLVGQVMKKTGGKANPKLVNELLKRALGE